MDKIYFASSDGSVRSSDDELYHLFGWKKEDAKYIDRKWKNGRWVYTYPEDVTGGNKAGGSSGAGGVGKQSGYSKITTQRKDTSNLTSSTTRIATGSGGLYETYNRGKIERAIDNAKAALGKFADDRKKDWEESKQRSSENAAKGHKGLYETDDLFSHLMTVTDTATGKKDTYYERGKIERYVDNAKEYVKDRLGFDEKAAMDKKHDKAMKASNEWDEARKQRGAHAADFEQSKKEYYEKRDEFYKTPIGRLTQAADAGKNFIENIVGKDVWQDFIHYRDGRFKR